MTAAPSPDRSRAELVRALAAVCDSQAGAGVVAPALGLAESDAAGHTEVFVMNCPPYASIYLGAEGKLGGEGTDRVAGFWRALGLVAPGEADHLAVLLGLYAHLRDAEQSAARPATKASLTRMRQALLWEHLWAWAPGYLEAVSDLQVPGLSAWASLTRCVLDAELAVGVSAAGSALPLALREAPEPISAGDDLDQLLDALVAPVRIGMIVTRKSLARAAGEVGVGRRIGERRFTLRAMLEQDPGGTLTWLAAEAGRWSQRYARGADLSSQWWAARSCHSEVVLSDLASRALRGRLAVALGRG